MALRDDRYSGETPRRVGRQIEPWRASRHEIGNDFAGTRASGQSDMAVAERVDDVGTTRRWSQYGQPIRRRRPMAHPHLHPVGRQVGWQARINLPATRSP